MQMEMLVRIHVIEFEARRGEGLELRLNFSRQLPSHIPIQKRTAFANIEPSKCPPVSTRLGICHGGDVLGPSVRVM